MARKAPKASLIFSGEAQSDLGRIYDSTAAYWGTAQAERYDNLIHSTLELIAANPKLGHLTEWRDDTRVLFVRWKNARYGHNLFYRELENAVLVIRVLHSSVDASQHDAP